MAENVILLDGWSLAYEPNHPAAIHLSLLLENLPDHIRPVIALPATPYDLLPARIEQIIRPTSSTPVGRLIWEQRTLPGLFNKVAARALHLFSGVPAFSLTRRSVISPAGYRLPASTGHDFPEVQPPSSTHSFWSRVREALWQGSLDRAGSILWPVDLPAPRVEGFVHSLPIIFPCSAWHADRSEVDLHGLDLPESFVLYHGPIDELALRRVLDAWSWAAAPIGESCPLVIMGVNPASRSRLVELVAHYQLEETVWALPETPLAALLEIYRRSSAVFHPAPLPPWGDALSLALGYGKPVVALESPWTNARLGPAAYLVRSGDSLRATSRALGAALVTIVVEESVSLGLVEHAGRRAAAWKNSSGQFSHRLGQVYHHP